MVLLYHDDPAFIEGLRRHDLLHDYGFRLHNTGLVRQPFGERRLASLRLDDAGRSGRWYYIDRISGGMPYQSLEGIEAVAEKLKDDPNFLGFQFHEWVNAANHDYRRIQELLIDKGLPFDREHSAPYEGRTESPFFGGGDFSIYGGIYRPIRTQKDFEQFTLDYFRVMSKRTAGQLMAVNGYYQFYHAALRLGAKNVMAEIGNQVPLTAMQVACVRGAARQYGKPFGVYYEPWGGSPFGCPCALGWSPWYPEGGDPDSKVMGYKIRPGLGSSRSLQRRLMYYAWLSGASWWSEEWGPENYFSDWKDYPLTDYGRITKEFLEVAGRLGPVEPVVPAAIVLPAETAGLDVRFMARQKERLYEWLPPDGFHVRMRHFAEKILAVRPYKYGNDDFNLTPSPWIGSFDVLSADAPPGLLDRYRLLVCMDEKQAAGAAANGRQVVGYRGEDEDADRCTKTLQAVAPVRIEGEVGGAVARVAGSATLVVGLFNNLGITKTEGRETADPKAARVVTVRGLAGKIDALLGKSFVMRQNADTVELLLPAGEVAILLATDAAGHGAGLRPRTLPRRPINTWGCEHVENHPIHSRNREFPVIDRRSIRRESVESINSEELSGGEVPWRSRLPRLRGTRPGRASSTTPRPSCPWPTSGGCSRVWSFQN
ncbi:MAG: hypothetical protein QUV05_07230 [Phycisphaerae bacterium]|nr:hypothetical protein [Phycisphaerae bacterium]